VKKRLRADFEGASAVEFALVLPVLLLLVFGVIYFGFAFNTKMTLTQSAREGARLGATFPVDETGAPTDDWYAAVFARIGDSAFGDAGLGNSPREICVGYVGPAGGTPQWRTSGPILESQCEVDVSPEVAAEPHVRVLVARVVPLEFIVATPDVRVVATAVARYEGLLPELPEPEPEP